MSRAGAYNGRPARDPADRRPVSDRTSRTPDLAELERRATGQDPAYGERLRRLRQPRPDLPVPGCRGHRPPRPRPAHRTRRDGGDRRRLRLGQVDPAGHLAAWIRRPPGSPGSPGSISWGCRAGTGCGSGAPSWVSSGSRPRGTCCPTSRRRRTSRCRCGSPAAGAGTAARRAELLDLMGIGHRADARPAEMSGGEQQRVAVAVATANRPKVIFADEPTGELDTATGGDLRRSAARQLRARGDHRHRHPRRGRGRKRRPYGGHPGRPDQQ